MLKLTTMVFSKTISLSHFLIILNHSYHKKQTKDDTSVTLAPDWGFADGTINDDKDRDRGWTVELALPWSSLSILGKGDNLPPKDTDIWRMDFSIFNQYKEAEPANDSGGWTWSPHGMWDSHLPNVLRL
jgi:hypothetical protein